MTLRRSTLIMAFSALGALAPAFQVAATGVNPRFISFEAPGAGHASGQGTGCFAYTDCSVLINIWGAVTGYYLDDNNVFHGFLRSPDGSFTSFEAPGADTTPQNFNGTLPNAINDAGVITGVYYDSQGVNHGFIRTPEGAITTFDPAGSTGTNPVALNLQSDVVGYFLNQDGVFLAFLRRADGSFATFSDPNACSSAPMGDFCGGTAAFNIGLFGTIVGGYEDNSGNFVGHGLIRKPSGALQTYEVPRAGGGSGEGTGCPGCSIGFNVFGAIAGYYIDATGLTHGYLRSPAGQFTSVDAPGENSLGINCYADCPVGLNDLGAMTGISVDANGVYHGFLRTAEGKISSFDAPGAANLMPQAPFFYSGTVPSGINDQGVITGFYIDAENVSHGFLLLP